MTQNILVKDLKAAKRELIDLKTAHKKGQGLLKVYKETIKINPPSSPQALWWLTISVNFGISPYPFAERFMVRPFDDNIISGSDEIEYTNNGWSAEFRMVFYNFSSQHEAVIFSTSPLESTSYSWSAA